MSYLLTLPNHLPKPVAGQQDVANWDPAVRKGQINVVVPRYEQARLADVKARGV